MILKRRFTVVPAYDRKGDWYRIRDNWAGKVLRGLYAGRNCAEIHRGRISKEAFR